jgi:hypothetical protein
MAIIRIRRWKDYIISSLGIFAILCGGYAAKENLSHWAPSWWINFKWYFDISYYGAILLLVSNYVRDKKRSHDEWMNDVFKVLGQLALFALSLPWYAMLIFACSFPIALVAALLLANPLLAKVICIIFLLAFIGLIAWLSISSPSRKR